MPVQEFTKEEQTILEKAKGVLEKGITAPEFSQVFFSPDGELKQLWKTPEDREQVIKSPIYKWLQEQLTNLRKKEIQQFEQAIDQVSGRLTVIIPKSLHAALKKEAIQEGVSVSELIRLKLAYPYRAITTLLTQDPVKSSI